MSGDPAVWGRLTLAYAVQEGSRCRLQARALLGRVSVMGARWLLFLFRIPPIAVRLLPGSPTRLNTQCCTWWPFCKCEVTSDALCFVCRATSIVILATFLFKINK